MGTTSVIFLDCDGVINNDEFICKWMKAHGDSDESMQEFKRRYYIHGGERGYVVPALLENLKRVCDETDCKIVWSSSWRESCWKPDIDTGEFHFDYGMVERIWRAKGFPFERFIGCTPCLDSSRFSYVPRGVEIQEWLDGNSERYNIGKAAVLDDRYDAFIGVEFPNARFFQTEFGTGLTSRIADELVKWLDRAG